MLNKLFVILNETLSLVVKIYVAAVSFLSVIIIALLVRYPLLTIHARSRDNLN